MSGFWAGTIPPWAWVLYVAAAGIFLILVIVAEAHGRRVGEDRGYEDGWREAHERRSVAVVKAAGMRAWVQTHPAELEVAHEERAPAALLDLERDALVDKRALADRTEVFGEWSVPLEYPPAPPAYAWEPWSLSADTTLEEEVAAMIANADASPSVRWLASLEPGQ